MAIDLKGRAIDREIDGEQFSAWPIPFDKMRPLGLRLSKIATEAAAAAFRGEESDIMIANGLDAVARHMDDKLLAELSHALGDASTVVVDGNPMPLVSQNQSLYFAGRPMLFLKWLTFAMEANGFASFFDGVKSAFGKAKGTLAELERTAAVGPPTTP